jgi:hypothetical protein
VLLPTEVRWSIDGTVAHELTHHALAQLTLPLWVEEGLTQMMEEFVTRQTDFKVNREMIDRHATHWSDRGLQGFWTGASFFSAEEGDQELSYHLAELLARRLLADWPKQFLAFLRQCEEVDCGAAASRRCLNASLGDLVAGSLGNGNWEPGPEPA